ncbi:MAG TPA: DUF5916 domain-containing protein [Longimicrobium sp.]|jgi:hypothetical protein|uniref:DUF5916 domain-containing protein n=1 Tax=Longimicrobium sp. TaxID=2029185 RepID=UPI002ED88BA7
MNKLALGIVLAVAASPARAQQPAAAPRAAAPEVPQAAARRTTQSIRVDGALDDAAWAQATPITEFRQLDPAEGQPATERTEIRVLYDDQALYIGARLYDRQPVRSRLGRRDMAMSASDWLTVILDSNHDHRTAVGFEVNPSGVRRDQTRSGDGEDDSWDPVWEAHTAVSDSGWTAEMRIPFSQLRFSAAPVQTWGLQVERQIARNQEFSVWSFTPRDQPGGIPRFGHLAGLERIPTGKRLEVLPYAVSRAENVDRGANPFRDDREYGMNVGVDLKYRLTSNMTLDATVNPDFGQVEVDPAVVNLTAFETQFEERRPFFVEGSEIFRFGGDGTNLAFYSRRIGRQPTLAPPYAERDVPTNTRILGAVKLSGRTQSGWSVGALNAVTRRETARFRLDDGENGTVTAEPLTNFFVGRARRETRAGQTALGGFVGAVNRNLDSDALSGALRSSAYSAGVDLFHQWDRRSWTLSGFLAGSHVRGEEGALVSTQQLPYHYFGRPDAHHLALDSSLTSLSGLAGAIQVNRRMGRLWSANARLNTISPGYEVSDLGFQRRADRIDAEVGGSYNESRPGRVLRRYSAYGQFLVEHNYDGENVSNRLFNGGSIQLLNYWSAYANTTFSLPGTYDDRLTRGGPAARRPGLFSINGGISTDPRKKVIGEFNGYYERTDAGGDGMNISGGVLLRPAPHWEVSLAPSLGWSHSVAQYLGRVTDPLKTETFGARYLFASLDQTTVALETRLNYTFTPALSLQVYAQPFIASGDFGEIKELDRPRTFNFRVYGRDVGQVVDGRIYPNGTGTGALSFPVPQPDFNFRSLRGNAVLRWEWRPGSTMYLAWQQNRSSAQPYGDFDLGRDGDELFGAAPDNVFLIKVSYWLNP